jgi:hypothetical protein
MPCSLHCPDRDTPTAPRRAARGNVLSILALSAVVLAGCSSPSSPARQPRYLLTIVSGNNQIATRGDTLPKSLVVAVTDSATGAAIANYSVGWGAPNRGGSIANSSTVTDGAGTSTARWILGDGQGADSVEAQTVDPAKTLRIVTFVATAVAP